jgi:hypothetical protein
MRLARRFRCDRLTSLFKRLYAEIKRSPGAARGGERNYRAPGPWVGAFPETHHRPMDDDTSRSLAVA